MSDLRHRLDAAASSIEPDPDLWAGVERRLGGRRRRPLVLVAIAAAAAVVAAVLIVPRVGHQPSVRVPAGPDESGTWRSLPPSPLPYKQGMQGHWVGHELVVFDMGTGKGQAYDPAKEAWRTLRPSPLAARDGAVEVVAGDRLLVWGGETSQRAPLTDGALYDPSSDDWTPVAASPLSPQTGPYSAWTGTEVLLWNGASGAAYDPAANAWRTIADAPDAGLPAPLSVLWTGSEMVVVGLSKPGLAYNPTTNSWRSFPRADIARKVLPRGVHPAGLPGGRIFVMDRAPRLYDPTTATWSSMPSAPVTNSIGGYEPINSVVTDDELVAWGPYEPGAGKGDDTLTTGEAFDLHSHTWRTFAVPNDVARGYPVAVWTGTEVLEWGGLGEPDRPGPLHTVSSGWAYTPPAHESATASPTGQAPSCPTAEEVAARANKKPRVVVTTKAEDPVQGQHLEPPPPDAAPKITADQAWASARNYAAPDPGPDPTMTLATFTSSMTGTHLAWVLVFRDAETTGPLGGNAPPKPRYLGTTVQPVDATNGIAMGMAQAG